jgi:hypothetical protein
VDLARAHVEPDVVDGDETPELLADPDKRQRYRAGGRNCFNSARERSERTERASS